jgi:hypothetical protein
MYEWHEDSHADSDNEADTHGGEQTGAVEVSVKC